MLNHKGYIGIMNVDDEAGIIHGEVINTRDVITFQGETVSQAREAFIESVEDYLAFCQERGEEPERPFSGKFQIRLTPEEHRAVYAAALREGLSLNQYIKQRLLAS
jgi:predicted HicB family RNase H-like nuclease